MKKTISVDKMRKSLALILALLFLCSCSQAGSSDNPGLEAGTSAEQTNRETSDSTDIISLSAGYDVDAGNRDSEWLTRAEAVQAFYDHYGYFTYENTSRFIDISGLPYAEAVVWAQHYGMLNWIDGNIFNGDEVLTRVELSAMLAAYFMTAYNHDLVVREEHGMTDYGYFSVTPGIEEVPDWAVTYVLHAYSSGMLGFVYDTNNNPNYGAFSGVTATELVHALEHGYMQTMWVIGVLTRYENSYNKAVIRKPSTNVEIALGMSNSDLMAISDMPIYDNWAFRIDNALVSCMDGLVSQIELRTLYPSEWEISGVGLGTSIETAFAMLGEPTEFYAKGTYPNSNIRIIRDFDVVVYVYDAEENAAANRDAASYYLELWFDDGLVNNLKISTVPTFSLDGDVPFYPNGFPLEGTVMLFETGSGDTILKASTPVSFSMDIIYAGTGDFSIKQDAVTLFACSGPYIGRKLFTDMADTPLDVYADGDWELTGKYVYSGKKPVSSGSGDFVFGSAFLFGKYVISHEGSGRFEVEFFPYLSRDLDIYNEQLVISVDGPFTEIIELEGEISMYPGDVVITADGNWTFERVFEFEVVVDKP